MNLLYLTFLEDSELYLGVKKKVAGQAAAFSSLGYSVTVSMKRQDNFEFYGQNSASYRFSGDRRLMKQFCAFSVSYITEYSPDIIYFRVDKLSSGIMKILRLAKTKNIKVILEIPNYPYARDYVGSYKSAKGLTNKAVTLIKSLICIADDRISGLFLKGKAQAAVIFGNSTSKFFGVPAKNFDNGISVNSLEKITLDPASRHIQFASAAGTLWWQGYERVLKGISEYTETHPDSGYTFGFTLIGGDPNELPEFKRLVKELGIERLVNCTGFKSGDELYKAYAGANIGVSTLGCYKRGLTHCSSLKSREYMAMGLPFIYAYEDPLIENRPFAKKFPNNDSVINMQDIISFYNNVASDEKITSDEIALAKEKFDWKKIMSDIMRFAGCLPNT